MSPLNTKISTTLLFLTISSSLAMGQLTWVKAYNVGCYYHTNATSVFTWDGGCQDSYCNGYGTIQWYNQGQPATKYTGDILNGKNEGYGVMYYANGYKEYEGNWKNDMENGFGTVFSKYGDTLFQGYFTDDQIQDYAVLDFASKKITEYVVAKLFDGGTNVKYQLVKAVHDRSGILEEIRVRMTFNGDIITTNYYDGTMVIKLKPLYVDFVNYNENFENYALLKISTTVLKGISDILDSSDKRD